MGQSRAKNRGGRRASWACQTPWTEIFGMIRRGNACDKNWLRFAARLTGMGRLTRPRVALKIKI